ncbi:hypothetical protein MT350_18545, partial [Rathayibacter sp. VKM Ac-2928]|nr:hypothetical protein [Rathayibacter sp. VKM Ac-2928]
MPSPQPARSRLLAPLTALAVGFGLLVAPAAAASAEEQPQTTIAGTWHTEGPVVATPPSSSARQTGAAAAPPINDDRANATTIPSLPYSSSGAPYDGATLEPGEEANCRTTDPDGSEYPTDGYDSIWYKYTSDKRQTLSFSAAITGQYSLVSAYVDGPVTPATRISCSETDYRRTNYLQAQAGVTYYFQVSARESWDGNAPSGTASLTVTSSAAIPNTTYSTATAVTALPATITTTNAKVDFNWYQPYSGCDYNAFMGSLWYKYTPTTTASVRADVGSSAIEANVGVYPSDGTTPGQLLECPVGQSVEADGYSFSRDRANTHFVAQAGKTYFIQVSGFEFNSGPITLQLTKVGTLTSAAPTVTGSGAVGDTLTAVPGTWGPQPVELSYQWLSGTSPINGATEPQFVVRDNELYNGEVSVRVTGTKAGYAPSARVSAPVPVTEGSLTNSVPTVTGSAAIGGTLTANPGNWGPEPVNLAYQWKRNGTAIAGATGSSYVVTSADSGTALTVSVTGTKYGYTTATRTSSATQV